MADLTESLEIAADPLAVYTLVSDLPRMGEWSPECTGITWRGGVTEPARGARFIGHNRSGAVRWSTSGEIVTADPGRAFTFEVTVGPVRVARWEYTFTPTGHGCLVTESWTDRRPRLVRATMDAALGSRARSNARGMRKTLAALRQAAERVGDPI